MNATPETLLAELKAAAGRAAADQSGGEVTPATRSRMRELREQLRRRLGTVDLAVPYIRELREG